MKALHAVGLAPTTHERAMFPWNCWQSAKVCKVNTTGPSDQHPVIVCSHRAVQSPPLLQPCYGRTRADRHYRH